MNSRHLQASEAANLVQRQTLFLHDGMMAPPVHGVEQQTVVPVLYLIPPHLLLKVMEASVSHQNLCRQWLSYQQSLQSNLVCFHATRAGSVGPAQPLPPPRSAEDAVCQEGVYREWLSYMQNYNTFMSCLEQLRNMEQQMISSQENGTPQHVEEPVFSEEDLDLLERIPGIFDLGKEMGFSF